MWRLTMKRILNHIFAAALLGSVVFGVHTVAHAASLGGYGALTPTNAITSTGSTLLDVIDKNNLLSAGVVRRAEIYRADNSWPIIRFKVWRSNGTNYDLVGESGAIDMSTKNTGTGKNSLALTNPITALAGDIIGVSVSAGPKSVSTVGVAGSTIAYRVGDVTSGSILKTDFTNFGSNALSIQFFDDDLLTSITPNTSYNDTTTSVTIAGRGFQSSATVKLTKAGQSDITATNVVVGSATSITADFALSGAPAGLWTVTVTNPDTTLSSFINGFSIYTHSTIFLGVGDSIAEGIPGYHGPATTGPSGDPLSQPWPYLSDLTGGTAFYNGGIGSTTSTNTNSTIQAMLTSKAPNKVYINIGVNDVGASVPSATYLSNMSAILTKVVNAGAELIVNQILPNSPARLTTPAYNAALEKWAFDNNVKLAPTFQEMAHPTSLTVDYLLNIAYSSGDLLHPNVAGYNRMAQLMTNAAVPSKKRVWGNTAYPLMSYESWKWFVLGGGATVTGNSDTGAMSLPQNATASSDVLAIQSGSKPIAIIPTTSAGTVSVSYRTSPTIFSKGNGAISWTSYTGPFTLASDQYIQVRLTGTSVSTASVDEMKIEWMPTTFSVTGPSSGNVNSASTNFTVTPDNLYTGTITLTPSGGGLSTPIVLTFTDATPQTFTITPTTGGTVTLTPSNNGGLTNPTALTYTANPLVPGAPTAVSATGGNAQAIVSFTPPASDGGATITSYTVTSSPGGVTATGSSSPITITGLTNGTPYTFTVTATNTAGTGSASSASNSVTPVAPDITFPTVALTAPSNATVVTGASVAITATASDDVSVSGVQFTLDGSPLQSEDTVSPYAITWDTTSVPDGTHTLTAVARDGSAHSTTSSPVVVTVDNTVPMLSAGSPTTTLAAGTTSTTLSLSTDEAATCKYDIAPATAYGAMTSTFTTTGSTTHSALVSGLTNGGTYTYYVRCADLSGNTTLTDYSISFSVGNEEEVHQRNTTTGYRPRVVAISTPVSPSVQPVQPATSSTSSLVFVRLLKQKSSGPEVRLLQQYLNTHGYSIAPSGVGSKGHETQYFGAATRAALKKFQQAHGLPADGIAGPRTYARMK